MQKIETFYVMAPSAGTALKYVDERFQDWLTRNPIRIVSVSHNCVDNANGGADEETRFLATILVVYEPNGRE